MEAWCKHHLPIVTLSLDPSPPCLTEFQHRLSFCTLSIFSLFWFVSSFSFPIPGFHHDLVLLWNCFFNALSSQIQFSLVSPCTLSLSLLLFHHDPFICQFYSFTMALYYGTFALSPCPFLLPHLLFHHSPFSYGTFTLSPCPFLLPLLCAAQNDKYVRINLSQIHFRSVLASSRYKFLPIPTCSQRSILFVATTQVHLTLFLSCFIPTWVTDLQYWLCWI